MDFKINFECQKGKREEMFLTRRCCPLSHIHVMTLPVRKNFLNYKLEQRRDSDTHHSGTHMMMIAHGPTFKTREMEQ